MQNSFDNVCKTKNMLKSCATNLLMELKDVNQVPEMNGECAEKLQEIEALLRSLGVTEGKRMSLTSQSQMQAPLVDQSWDVTYTHCLGKEASEHMPKATLLDEAVSASISRAVDGLNL